jgi:hypothetical protein
VLLSSALLVLDPLERGCCGILAVVLFDDESALVEDNSIVGNFPKCS